MNSISFYIVPCMMVIIITFGIAKKIDVFDSFISGAKEGVHSTFSIVPSIIGLITAVSMLKASGFLDIFSSFLSLLFKHLGIPTPIIPLMILRPISGSGSLALLDSILSNFGPDSFAGRVASVLMGSTETTFYAVTVYLGSVNIKNSRHAIPAPLLADLSIFILSCIFVRMLFYGT